MSRHVFEWGRDENGNRGWIMQGMPHFDAVDGRNVVHDTMEHLPGGMKHGVIADEMLALGVRLYLRVGTGWWWNMAMIRVTPEDTWAMEVMRQLEYIFADGRSQPGPVRTVPQIDDDLDHIIVEGVKRGIEQFNREFADGEDLDPVDPSGELATNLADWLRVGVMAGERRWNHPSGSAHDAMLLAEDLERQVDKYGHCEDDEQLVVEINERGMRVRCYHRELSEVYPEEPY